MDRKVTFQQIQPSIYNIFIYLTFKYMDIEFYLYLEEGGCYETSSRKDRKDRSTP